MAQFIMRLCGMRVFIFSLSLGLLLLALPCGAVAATNAVYRLVLGGDHRAAQAVEEPYVKRSCAVSFDLALFAANSPVRAGDAILFEVMDGLAYTVTVQRVTRDRFGSVSLLGALPGSSMCTVTLTARNGAVVGTLRDLQANTLFVIRCQGGTRSHVIMEYDVPRMPAPVDYPARIPPSGPETGGGP
jgi:hypothetical protein